MIGTAASGMAPLGNGLAGVLIDSSASGHIIGGNTAGAANVIAFNFGAGVAMQPWTSSSGHTYVPQQNMSRLNSIHSNGELGIDLNDDGVTLNDTGDPDTGPNELQSFPLIRGVSLDGGNSTVIGTINSTSSTSFTIDLYGNNVGDPSGHGEGEVYLGTTTAVTDATGDEIGDTDLNVRRASDAEDIAMLLELGVGGTYNIRPNVSIRASYDMMWMVGMARAAEQLDFNLNRASQLSNDAVMFTQGISLGIECLW